MFIAPFVPSPIVVVQRMLRMAELKPGEVLFECIKYLREHGGSCIDKGSDYEFVYDKKYFGPLAANSQPRKPRTK